MTKNPMEKVKTIALISHDGMKQEIVDFAKKHKKKLENFKLIATGTTGKMIEHATGLKIKLKLSGPVGGDAQIASRVAEEKIDAVIFFVDPLHAHPHEPDIQGLLRVCNVHNIPLATNRSTAELFMYQKL